ncbi:MAG: hypothetical protein PVJ19_18835, partial [Desulfobacteraceae bacterium]
MMDEGDESKITVNTGKEYTVYILPRILIVGEGESFGYAIQLSIELDNKREICVTQYHKTSLPPTAEDRVNLRHIGTLDVTKKRQWEKLKVYGSFEAVIFNNPHVGYSLHRGEIFGVRKGKKVSEIFYTTLKKTLKDYSLRKRKRNVRKELLFEENISPDDEEINPKEKYLVKRTTMGKNEFILRKYCKYGPILLKPGGKLIVHGPADLRKLLSSVENKKNLGFTNGGRFSASPYYASYTPELTPGPVHPSMEFDPRYPP